MWRGAITGPESCLDLKIGAPFEHESINPGPVPTSRRCPGSWQGACTRDGEGVSRLAGVSSGDTLGMRGVCS